MPKEKGGKRNKAEQVERLTLEKVKPIVEDAGYELWDVIFEKEGAMWFLKVLFDKKGGGLDDSECEALTGPINDAVDKLPIIDLVDVVEVGSPGLDRVLRNPAHFAAMKGEPVKVTVKGEDGRPILIRGTLGDFDEVSGRFVIFAEDGEKEFTLAKCSRVSLDL